MRRRTTISCTWNWLHTVDAWNVRVEALKAPTRERLATIAGDAYNV